MGIAAPIVRAILREHRFKPITGDVLLIGRQTVSVTVDEAVEMLRQEGIALRDIDTGADGMTDRSTRSAAHGRDISDIGFFALFTDAKVHTLDVSDYEGAEIIHDLHDPIPGDLAHRFDFIFNGSCLDNIFDPAAAVKNIAKMLRPDGGRLFDIEVMSPNFNAYVTLSQAWHFDFYALNDFADCKIYTCAFYPEDVFRGPYHIFAADSFEAINSQFPARSVPEKMALVAVIVAETGAAHTRCAKSPLQQQYRPECAAFRQAYARFSASPRPLIGEVRSRVPWGFRKKRGARYLGQMRGA